MPRPRTSRHPVRLPPLPPQWVSIPEFSVFCHLPPISLQRRTPWLFISPGTQPWQNLGALSQATLYTSSLKPNFPFTETRRWACVGVCTHLLWRPCWGTWSRGPETSAWWLDPWPTKQVKHRLQTLKAFPVTEGEVNVSRVLRQV